MVVDEPHTSMIIAHTFVTQRSQSLPFVYVAIAKTISTHRCGMFQLQVWDKRASFRKMELTVIELSFA